MKMKRKLALLTALSVFLSSIPNTHLIGHAAEELIVESEYAQEMHDHSDHEASADELMLDDIVIEDVVMEDIEVDDITTEDLPPEIEQITESELVETEAATELVTESSTESEKEDVFESEFVTEPIVESEETLYTEVMDEYETEFMEIDISEEVETLPLNSNETISSVSLNLSSGNEFDLWMMDYDIQKYVTYTVEYSDGSASDDVRMNCWYQIPQETDQYGVEIFVYGGWTQSGELVYLALKKDGSNIHMPYCLTNSQRYDTGEYQLAAWVDGREAETMVTEDIFINGLNTMNAIPLSTGTSCEISCTGQTRVYKLESEENQLYRYYFESEQDGECSLFCVDNQNIINAPKVNQIESGKLFSYSGLGDRTYYLAVRGSENADIYNATLTYEKMSVNSVSLDFSEDNIFDIWTMVDDLQNEVTYSIHYDEDGSDYETLKMYPQGYTRSEYINGEWKYFRVNNIYTRSDECVILALKKDGIFIDIPYAYDNSTKYPTGEYQLIAYIEGRKEETMVTRDIIINGLDQMNAVSLSPNNSVDINYTGQTLVYKLETDNNQEYRYTFDINDRGKYVFFSVKDDIITGSTTYDCYERYSFTFVAEEGCSYYVGVVGDSSLSTFNATLSLEKADYGSARLDFRNDTVFDIWTMKHDIQNEVTYTFTDNGSDFETFNMYPSGLNSSLFINDRWEDFKVYSAFSRYNEHIVLALKKDGEYIHMPYENIWKYPSGEYQLVAYVEGHNETTMVVQDIIINGLDQMNAICLMPGNICDVNYAGQSLVYKLETEDGQKYRYKFESDETGEYVFFSVKDDMIASTLLNQAYSGTYYNFTAEEGYSYYIAVRGVNYAPSYNATFLFEKSNVGSVNLNLKYDNVFDIWTMEYDLQDEITYTINYTEDGSDSETLIMYPWWYTIPVYNNEQWEYFGVYSNHTRYGERVDLALKKDGAYTHMPYEKNMKYPTGMYQLTAYVSGREEETTVSQDIFINGLDQMNAVSLLPGSSCEVDYYGQSLVYKLETEADQPYRYKFNSDEIGEVIFFKVKDGIITDSLKNTFYYGGSATFTAEDGYSYYLAVSGENDASFYNAVLTLEEIHFPVEVSVNMPSVNPDNLVDELRYLPVTVTYDNGEQKTINEWYMGYWSWFENVNIEHYAQDIDGLDHIEILLYEADKDGNRGELISMPYWSNSSATIPLGQMYLRVMMRDSQGNEISTEVPFEIKGEPEQVTAIELGNTYTINGLEKDETRWFTFIAPDSRKCTITFDTADRVLMNVIVYEYTENEFKRILYREGIDSRGWQPSFNITAGKKYAFIVKPYRKAITEDIHFTITMNRKLSSIEFLQPGYYFSGNSIPADMRKIQLLATYDDGSTHVIKNLKTKYKNGLLYLFKKGPEDEKIFIGLKTLPDENGVTEKLDVYDYDFIREGNFTLYAEVKGNTVNAEVPVTVEAIPSDAVKLSSGNTYDYNMQDGRYWIELIPEEMDKSYNLSIDSLIGDVDAWIYEYSDGMYSDIADTYIISQADGSMTFTPETGKRYALELYVYTAFSAINGEGTISFAEKNSIVSAEILGDTTYNALNIHKSIFNIPVELTYTDGSKEVLDAWSGTYYEDEDDYEAFRRTLYTNTSDNTRVFMRMYDAEGINQIHMPYYSGDLEDQDVYLGAHQLQVFVDISDTPLTSKNISIELSDDAEISENQVLSGYMNHETAVFKFTAETSGEYIFKDLNAQSDVLYKVYRYNAEENKLESVYANIYSYGIARFTAEEGQQFYLTADSAFDYRSRMARFSLVKNSAIESIELVSESIPTEIAAGLDKLQLSQMYAKLTYADGTSQTVRFNKSDSFGNTVYTNTYKVLEDGNVDWEDLYKTNSKFVSGTYYVTAEVYIGEEDILRTGMYVSVKPIIEMAAAGKTFTDGLAEVSTVDGYYTYLSYTPEVSGVYVFAPDVFVDKLRIFNEEGAELPKSWKDEYSVRVELTEGQTYAVAVRSDEINSFSMTVEPEKTVQEVVLEEITTLLIAGLDTISNIGKKVVLTLTNGETITLNENNEFVDGNGFRYEVVNVNTGEKVNASTVLTAGEYQITAVQRTGTAIYMTGSTVASSHTPARAEYRTGSAVYQTGQVYYQTGDYKTGSAVKYHTGSAVTRENVKSNSVTVHVQAITAEGLEVLKEEEAAMIEAGTERQLYAFTPEKTAVYELEHQTDLTWDVYEIGEEGLIPAPELLEAGTTYIICLNNVWRKQAVMMTANVMAVSLDETKDVQISAFAKEGFVFTPETDGLYEVTVKCVSDSENAEIIIDSQIGSTADTGTVSLKGKMTGGTAYKFELQNMSSLEQSYQITVKNISDRVPTELIVDLAEGVYYRTYLSTYEYEDMFDVYVKYSDGTIEEKHFYEKDAYGFKTEAYWNNAASYERDTVTYVYYITYGNLATYKKVVCQRYAPAPIALTEGTKFTTTVGDGGVNYFQFTPEEDGEYYLKVEGISYSTMELDDGLYGNPYELEANVCYTFRIKALDDPAGTEMTVTVSEKNEITGLKLLTAAESCYPAVGMYGAKMTAEVTYADGTTQVIKGKVAPDDSYFVDAYGNKICMTYKLLTNNKVRVYLSCGSYRVYSDADILQPADLPALSVDNLTELVPDDIGFGYTLLASFTPSETGAYELAFGGDYDITDVPYFMDPVTGKKDDIPAVLTADKTYVAVLEVRTIENGAITVRPVLKRIECTGEHTWNTTPTIDIAATCTAPGSQSIHCSICDVKDETTVTEIPMLEHVWDEYQYDDNATDEASGTETAYCINGCGASDTRDVSDLAEGTCGSSLTWTLRRNGTLIISGKGSMTSYSASTQPWAAYQNEIKKAVIESGVTYIGQYAFYRCTNLEEISIPDTVTGIGKYAFYYCSSLNNVVVPEGVTYINEFTFYGCKSMKNLTLPTTLEKICKYAFADCVFGDLVIPEGVTSFEGYVFYMSNWDSLILPSTLTTMGTYVFSNSGGVKGIVTTPEGVIYIPQGTYCMCGNMTGIVIHDGVKSIDYNVFRYCNKLTEVWIPESVTYIDSRAFYGLTPSKITIYGYAGTTAETYATTNGFNFVLLEEEKPADKTILQEMVTNAESSELLARDYTEESWDNYLSMLKKANEVLADESATQNVINQAADALQRAFESLKKHAWNNGVEVVDATCCTVGERVYTCTVCGAEYKEEIPADGTLHKFVNYKADGNATCTEHGTETAACSYGCGTVDTRNASSGASGHAYDGGIVTKHQTCMNAGERTYSCTVCEDSYTEIIMADGIHQFDEYQYNNDATCTEDGTKTAECSYGCGTTDTISEEGSALGHSFAEYVYDGNATDEYSGTETAFCNNGCGSSDTRDAADLAEGTCGSSLIWTLRRNGTLIISGKGSMKNYDFSTQPWSAYRTEIKKAVIENGVTNIGEYAFASCTNLEEVIIPNSVQRIESFAFYYCKKLNNVTIPEGVTFIQRYTFYRCESLKNLTLPGTLTGIGAYAFGEAILGDLVIPEGVTVIEGYAFYIALWDSLTLPSTLNLLGEYVFSNSGGVKGIVTTPEGVTSIPRGTYCMCGNMTGIVIRDGVKSIDDQVFRYCRSLKEVWIPESVTYIGSSAFYGLTPSEITIYGYAGSKAETYATTNGFNFVTLKTEGIVDKTILQETILNIESAGLKESDYSAASWAAYASMFTTAKTVLSDNTATQKMIDQAVADLQAAYESLEKHVWDKGIITVSATCCTVGERIYTCSGCQAEYTEVIPADGVSHKFVTYTANGDATCTDNGTETAVCSWGCGKSDIRNAASGKLNHTYNAGEITVKQDCSNDGLLTYRCTVCDDSYTEPIPADGVSHDFGEYKYNNNATCTEDGTETAKCIFGCEAVDERSVAGTALGHLYTLYISNEDATCFEDGTETAVCEHDGCDSEDTQIEVGSRLSHSFVSYDPDGNATCMSNGTETAECEHGCGITDTREALTGALGHSLKHYTDNQDETCEVDGTRTWKCDNCSETFTAVRLNSRTGHDFEHDEWIISVDPTCTENGQKIKYCSHGCGLFETEVIPAVGHDYEDQELKTDPATEDTDGKQYYECANGCGEIYIVNVLVKTAAQDAMKEIYNNLEIEGNEVGTSIEEIQKIDNQSLIDSVEIEENGEKTGINGMELVNSLEKAVIADANTNSETPNVVESTGGVVDSETGAITENSDISISGAAVTVAAAINQDDQNSYKAGEEYRAQLAIEEKPVMTASVFSRGRTVTPDVYMVDIHLNIVDSNDAIVESNVSLAAPVQITMPVEAGVITDNTKLYHFENNDQAPVEIRFTDNGDGTITFCTPSFSTYCFENKHSVWEWTTETEATCTQSGSVTGICIGCGKVVRQDVDMLPHDYVERSTAATCSVAGEKYNECSVCGRSERISIIPATGEHSYKASIFTEASCTKNGVRRFSCTACNAFYDEVIPGGHSFETGYEIDVPATCINEGSKSIHCKNCDMRKNETVIPKKDHVWKTSGRLTKVPTCTEDGEMTYSCTQTGCTETDKRTVDANDHSFNSYYTVDVEATCNTKGTKSRHCMVCDIVTDEKDIAATGDHKFTIETDDKQDATCTDAGWIVYQCATQECKETNRVTLDKLDHVYGDFETVEPTCTETGSRAKYCIYECGTSFGAETIPAKGHELERIIDRAENCVTDGSQHVECINCDYSGEATTIPASAIHDFASEYTVDRKATCTSEGIQSRHCINCDVVTDETSIAKEAHVWDNGVISKPSDCVNEGEKLFTCLNCKTATRTEKIKALGHDYASSVTVDKASTCTSEGSQSRHCSRCDSVTDVKSISKIAHNYQNYTVTKEPTAVSEGISTGTCSCGATDPKPVDKLPGTIKLAEKSVSLQVNKSVKLDKLVSGFAEGDSIASVKTSDKKIVSVSGTSKITGKKAGKTATITVVLASGTTAEFKVKVQKNAVKTTGISGVSTKLKMKKGDQITVTPVIKPVTTTDKLTYTTSNKKIVTVNKNGVITAKASGKAKITVKSGNKKKVINVTVEKIAPTEISGIPASKTLKKGKSFTLKAKLLPKNSEATISFKSSNNKVVTVNAKGKVTAKKKGTAKITVKAGKVSAVCNVTVK